MAKSTAFGIVLTDSFAQRLSVSAEFRRGAGMFHADCNVTQSVRVVLYAVMEAVGSLESYVDGLSASKFASHDLYITMSDMKRPIDGESYGLPLAIAIVGAMLSKTISEKTCFTGVIEPAGMVLPVQGIEQKRKFASMLGFNKIVLPAKQLDLLESNINQCPVESIYGAVAGYFYEEA